MGPIFKPADPRNSWDA